MQTFKQFQVCLLKFPTDWRPSRPLKNEVNIHYFECYWDKTLSHHLHPFHFWPPLISHFLGHFNPPPPPLKYKAYFEYYWDQSLSHRLHPCCQSIQLKVGNIWQSSESRHQLWVIWLFWKSLNLGISLVVLRQCIDPAISLPDAKWKLYTSKRRRQAKLNT